MTQWIFDQWVTFYLGWAFLLFDWTLTLVLVVIAIRHRRRLRRLESLLIANIAGNLNKQR